MTNLAGGKREAGLQSPEWVSRPINRVHRGGVNRHAPAAGHR